MLQGKTRLPDLSDLRKKFWVRVPFWSFSLSFLLLIDEYIKEGYIFNPYDILTPGTHENLFIIFTSFGIYALCKNHKLYKNPKR